MLYIAWIFRGHWQPHAHAHMIDTASNVSLYVCHIFSKAPLMIITAIIISDAITITATPTTAVLKDLTGVSAGFVGGIKIAATILVDFCYSNLQLNSL